MLVAKDTLCSICQNCSARIRFGRDFLGQASKAQSDLDRHLGPIANFVDFGQQGAWTSGADQKWYTLSNDGALGEVQYFWASQPDIEGRDFSLAANVYTTPTHGDLSHAGLLFHYRDGEGYLAVTIASDGGVYAFIRSAEGLDVTPVDGPRARLDGSDVLEIVVRGNDVAAFLNGERALGIQIGGRGPTRNLGILAAGSGVAAFTGMTIR